MIDLVPGEALGRAAGLSQVSPDVPLPRVPQRALPPPPPQGHRDRREHRGRAAGLCRQRGQHVHAAAGERRPHHTQERAWKILDFLL